MVASHALSIGDLAGIAGMCPDWESNLQPFGSQADTQSTEPHEPGLDNNFEKSLQCIYRSSVKSTHLSKSFIGNKVNDKIIETN